MKRFVAFLLFAATTLAVAQAPRPILLGYVRGPNHLIAPGEINARKLTRIHYAFLHPQDGIVAATSATDDANLRTLVALKQQNPSLEVLISVGCGAHSMGFSELALTAASRAKFVASCMELIAKYSLDGIDIDWEYPGSAFPGHPTRREEDKLITRSSSMIFAKPLTPTNRRPTTNTFCSPPQPTVSPSSFAPPTLERPLLISTPLPSWATTSTGPTPPPPAITLRC